MEEIIRIKDQFYILANSSLAEVTTRVLKHADTFLVTDRHGDIRPLGFEDHGLFHKGTRFLSRFALKLDGRSPLLLSSTVKENNDFLVVDLTNSDFESKDGSRVHQGNVHLERTIFLWEGCCYEAIKISNYRLTRIEFFFSLEFDADFADIFEVRGMKRKEKGNRLNPIVENESVILVYKGLDGVVRKTRMDISPKPDEVGANQVGFHVKLDSHQEGYFYLTISCEIENEPPQRKEFVKALHEVGIAYQTSHEGMCMVETSNEQFNDWLNRSMADLHMMLTKTQYGIYPYAGIPWFNAIFGRDGIITAFETLWLYPGISRGVLSYLAAHQADSFIPEKDAEPGKILHEERKGEMANLKEIPFGQYYGTVDATPLFIILAGHYYERTGDKDFIQQLWPNIEHALDWIDTYGDLDKDGFVEYKRGLNNGLSNQGWKDSEDSIFHADGGLAFPPIALCEVQGYVYEAKTKAAQIALLLGKQGKAEKLHKEAETLRQKFINTFWCEELGTYALALDGEKRACNVKSSNAGHCLFSGIASEKHAPYIIQNFMDKSFFSGWGIRTIDSSQARYNPMSYHNGSIWPHDNALVAFGMGRYGFKVGATKILTSLFDASIFLDLHRLPELFCGFERRRGEGPTLYPVACDPQSWASGAVFLLLQACLGLSIQAQEKKVYFNYPTLPAFLQHLTIKNLKVNSAFLDIAFQRLEKDVAVSIMRKEGEIELVVIK
jgi:glycogen debranching enzyme